MAISSNFRSDLTRAPNKPLPKWNFAPIDAVGTVQDHQGLSGDAFGHDKFGYKYVINVSYSFTLQSK